jgi:hypothetical protein
MTRRGATGDIAVVFLRRGSKRRARRNVESPLTWILFRQLGEFQGIRLFPAVRGSSIFSSRDSRIFNHNIQSIQLFLRYSSAVSECDNTSLRKRLDAFKSGKIEFPTFHDIFCNIRCFGYILNGLFPLFLISTSKDQFLGVESCEVACCFKSETNIGA